MRIFIQMDHPRHFRPASDSTMALALEAQQRGHEVHYFLPEALFVEEGTVKAAAHRIHFFAREENFYEQEARIVHSLESADVILIRQEPPYNMQYLTNCWLLERLGNPLILNNPAAIRRRPEKLFPLALAEYAPETVIAYEKQTILDFYTQHQDIIIKPLYAHGGKGIVRIKPDDTNIFSILEMLLDGAKEPVIAQPFLPEVMTEEKRVLLIDGTVVGAYNRIPREGDFRANGILGGSAEKTELTHQQQQACAAVGEICRQERFFFVGLDLIGDKLIEVNTTCPTGIRKIESLYDKYPARIFWDRVEQMR